MDILKALSSNTDYSDNQLQAIIGAWVMTGVFERKPKISTDNGDVAEDDYDKRSIYSLLYSLYRTVGVVNNEHGTPYEFTFNTWGYAWPSEWGEAPTTPDDPQKFGKNAYSGLVAFPQVKEYAAERDGKVHIVEMGCGTGAGAHHIAKNLLPECTYEAIDMQASAIQTCRRRHVPELNGRLRATCADCTEIDILSSSADIVTVCETHVTEMEGVVTPEDERFFQAIRRILKPGGFLAWGNAIPDATWQPCFDYLESIGMKVVEVRDVTEEAIRARDEDEARIEAYVDQAVNRFHGFRIPVVGRRKRQEAEIALKNFSRHPHTNLYQNMVTRQDTYRVVLVQKAS